MSTSAPDEELPSLDRKGPTYGISFSRSQADQLIRQHLNMTIKSIEFIDTGYNNLIFFIDTNESSERYALKIGGRYWIRIKTEAEVQSLRILAEFTTIPVPRVFAYSSDRTNEFGVEWILMSRLPGENMSKICEKQTLSFNAIRSIIKDLAEFVSQMHWKIPRRKQIGAFRLNGEISTDLDGRGPWPSYEQFVRQRAQAEISLLNKDPVFAPIKDVVLQAIEQFDQLKFPSFENLPFVFTHGDLDVQNILISMENSDAPRVTGIVDWEWTGSFPCSEQFFNSFDFFLQHKNENVRQMFFDEFEKRDVSTPRTIEKFSLIDKINRFLVNLAPWDLTDLIDPDDPTVKKRLEKSSSIVVKTLEEMKNEIEFNVIK